MNGMLLRTADLIGIGVSFSLLLIIGVICARRNRSAESYFLADRRMPGWVVGISLMATIVSSMTFLATPGFAYKENWRYMPTHFTYLIARLFRRTSRKNLNNLTVWTKCENSLSPGISSENTRDRNQTQLK